MQYARENAEKMTIRSPTDGLAVLNSIWKSSQMGEVQEGDEVRPGVSFMQVVNPAAMRDPRFDHTVILMLRHDRDGAFGIVINRPTGERPLADLLAAVGDKNAGDKNAQGSGNSSGNSSGNASGSVRRNQFRNASASSGGKKFTGTLCFAGWLCCQTRNPASQF